MNVSHTPASAPRPNRRARRVLAVGLFSGLFVGAVATGSSTAATATSARPMRTVGDSAYVGCMSTSGSAPDVLEHYVESCRIHAASVGASYTDCLSTTVGTADASERWVQVCADRVG